VGFPVILATEGQKGVEKAIEENPYLILMDILMAGMDGREVTRMIRSIPETQDIPVLAATLLLKHLDRKAALKPDALITLLSQLASWRRKRRFRPLFLVQAQISYNRRWHREIFLQRYLVAFVFDYSSCTSILHGAAIRNFQEGFNLGGR